MLLPADPSGKNQLAWARDVTRYLRDLDRRLKSLPSPRTAPQSDTIPKAEQPPPWQVLSFTPANLLTLYPGLTNGLIPTNVLTGITIDPEADLWISVRHTTDGKRIISAEIIALDSPPASPSCELGGAPATFDWPVVLRAQGRFFQLEYANLSFQPFEAWRETVANPEPAAPQWQSWWTWKRY